MGSEWTTIGAVAEVFDGPHATPKKIDSGPYFLSISSLEAGKLDLMKSARLSEKDFVRWTRRVTPIEGDVLFSYETRLGEAALMPANVRACLGRRMGLLRPKRSKVIPEYLLYSYLSPQFQGEIRTRTVPGCTVDRIPLKDLSGFPIRIPSMKEQHEVVRILSAIDRKIELNRQTNQTLESMAQALFKSWFVDFDPVIDNALAAGNEIPEPLAAKAAVRRALREQGADKTNQPHTLPDHIRQLFPSRFQFTEELGWIPEGWEAPPLYELINLLGGGTPKTSNEEYWGGDIPWFSVVDAPAPSDVFVIDTEKSITEAGLNNSSTKLLPVGATIISARGTVGKCARVARPMAMNQSCYGVTGKGNISDSFVYYSVYLQVGDLQQRGHGSVFNTITRDTFIGVMVPFGGEQLTIEFEKAVSSYFSKIENNAIQSKTLTQLRDNLLPKLLSGELRIPEAEKTLDEALA